MKKFLLIALLAMLWPSAVLALNPKREFRGAWLHTVFQDHYLKRTTAQNQAYLREQLDKLQAAGVNAVVFQVRPQADSFYASKLEPWSRFLTNGGAAPSPAWDPLEFIIGEAHARGMELHAWLNPYRVTSSKKQTLPKGHIYHQHPEWFVRYDGKLYFDPGIPESRSFITAVVMDIVERYDVDGIHFDDYFYPYPVKGVEFPDSKSFAKYGKGMKRDDWRRKNVDMLIEGLHEKISTTKPWVVFGISPFGIWRNKKSDPRGSDTNGLQNYDDLYADILHWVKEGWIDYNMPQIYWEIDHPAADYITLIQWWNKNATLEGPHLYIGQDVARTMKASQLTRKMRYERALSKVKGNCFWPANELLWNNKGVADSLKRNYHRYPALIPAYTHMHNRAPQEVKKLKKEWTADGYMLHWKAEQSPTNPELASYFVVYRFEDKEPIDLSNPAKIVKITRNTRYLMPYDNGKKKYRYIVTAVDRFHNENTGKSIKVKL